MDKSGKTIGMTIGIKLIASLLAALLLEGFLAMAGICHGTGAQGISLWPGGLKASSGYQISEKEDGSLEFIQESSDPQMYFAAAGVPYGSLRLVWRGSVHRKQVSPGGQPVGGISDRLPGLWGSAA